MDAVIITKWKKQQQKTRRQTEFFSSEVCYKYLIFIHRLDFKKIYLMLKLFFIITNLIHTCIIKQTFKNPVFLLPPDMNIWEVRLTTYPLLCQWYCQQLQISLALFNYFVISLTQWLVLTRYTSRKRSSNFGAKCVWPATL